MMSLGTNFWKLLVIIVREKCGLPHHINYFCSPTYHELTTNLQLGVANFP